MHRCYEIGFDIACLAFGIWQMYESRYWRDKYKFEQIKQNL
jgi:hypothetical protein